MILFDDAQHHLLLEREEVRIQVMNETLSWLESHYEHAHTRDGPKIQMEPQLMEEEQHEEVRLTSS